MRAFCLFMSVVLLSFASGCSPKPRPARARSREGRPERPARSAPRALEPDRPSSGDGGSIDPRLKEAEVAVVETETQALVPPGGRVEDAASQVLALKLKVTSHRPRTVMVSPERFVLEDRSGNPMPPRNAHRTPELTRTYLRDGESIVGWIAFEVPAGAESFKLKTSLRDLPLEISVSASGGASDGCESPVASGGSLAEALLYQVKVEVEEIARRPAGEGRASAGSARRPWDVLGLKVKVTNRKDSALAVAPSSFLLDDGTGQSVFSPKRAEGLEPFPSTNLNPGESARGWLAYEVPADLEAFRLTSDLRTPPLAVPIRTPRVK
ncbi:MAG: DUF4352 domain-containing protein [Planctomycetota bacterium]